MHILGGYLRNDCLGFVPVFEFLFAGVCRREQRLEVKNYKSLTEHSREFAAVCQQFHFLWCTVNPLLRQQPTSFWTADNLCRSYSPSRGCSNWIGRLGTQGERHPLYLLYASLIKGSLGLVLQTYCFWIF